MELIFFEKAEAYLSGKMTEPEKLKFEEELSANAEMQSLFDDYAAIGAKMALYKKYENDEGDFKMKLTGIKTAYLQEEQKETFIVSGDKAAAQVVHLPKVDKKVFTWRNFAAAAIVIGVIVLAATLYVANKNQQDPVIAEQEPYKDSLQQTVITDSPQTAQKANDLTEENNKTPQPQNHTSADAKMQQLYAQYFTPDALPQQKEGLLADAYYYYSDGRYKEAITAIQDASYAPIVRGAKADTLYNSFYAPYYTAQSLMASGAAGKAIPILKKALVQSPGEAYTLKTNWYLALAYLHSGNTKNAEILLQQISTAPNNEYAADATEILTQMRKK